MSMKTSASQLKAKMGRYMRAIRAGRELVITDRGEPVARLLPYRDHPNVAGLVVSQPRDPTAPPLGLVDVRPIRYDGTSTTQLLREDRDRR
jgi:prevent-host-death family protein